MGVLVGDEVDWGLADFVLAAVLLGGSGLLLFGLLLVLGTIALTLRTAQRST